MDSWVHGSLSFFPIVHTAHQRLGHERNLHNSWELLTTSLCSPCLWLRGRKPVCVCACVPPLHKMPAVQIVSVQHPAEEEARVHPSDLLHYHCKMMLRHGGGVERLLTRQRLPSLQFPSRMNYIDYRATQINNTSALYYSRKNLLLLLIVTLILRESDLRSSCHGTHKYPCHSLSQVW